MLEYKLRSQGKQLIKIDKWYPSSQLCHVCGYKNAETKNLSVRKWDCPTCGSHHNRDKNAAINIKEEAKRSLSEVTSKDTMGCTGIYACGESVSRSSFSELQCCSR